MKRVLIFALAALFCQTTIAQTKITGTVTSSQDGTPVQSAIIIVKGNNSQFTTTDNDGKFVLNNVAGDAVLVVNSQGFVTQEVSLDNRTTVNIILASETKQLDEVMVVAYGTSTKGTFTGSASVVSSDKLKDIPITSFESALAGKVPGMQITGNSAQAGSAVNVRIRGTGSMNATNEPLYVIDGIPAISGDQSQLGGFIFTTSNVMSTLNPNDIESITVLKDAAASALYGSRAANGVVVITTKKGKAGKAKVNLKSSISLTPQFATNNWETATPEQILEMYYELFWNGRKQAGKTDHYADSVALRQMNNRFNKHGYSFSTTDETVKTLKVTALTDGKETRADANGNPIYYDWEKALFRTGVFQNVDLSISGGTENTSVYSSVGYTKDKGRTDLNEFSRLSGRVNVTQKVGKIAELATIAGFSSTDKIGFNDSRHLRVNSFYLTRNLLWPLYWPTDYKTGLPWTAAYGSSARNVLYYNNTWDNSSKTARVSASEALTVKFMSSLSLKSILSYDYTSVQDHLYYSALHYDYTASNGSITEMRTNIAKLVSSTTLNFHKTFAEKNEVSALAGFEAEKNNTDFTRANGTQLATSTLHTLSTAGSTTSSGYQWGSTMASMLSRVEYNYDQKYFLSGSFRRDGSSQFGPDNRWGNFWSVSGAWSIHKETFMENLADMVNNLRLRLAYGVNGTTPSSYYGWRSLSSYGAKYMEKPGGGLANIGNDQLTWENNYTTDIGLDFGLFKNRLHGTIDYFNRNSKNLLMDAQVSRVTGFLSTLKNVGEMNNKGLEVEIGGDIVRTKDITWDASVSASFIKTKITKLYGGANIIYVPGYESGDYVRYIYKEGYSNLTLYGREWAGVDQTNGKNVWYTNNDKNDPSITGFKKNVSYNLTDADQIPLADMNPKAYGGINTSVSWKNITLGLNFIYKIGGHVYDQMSRDVNDDGYYWERIMAADTYDGRWTYYNQSGRYPLRVDNDLEDAMGSSSRHLNPADFLRLRTVSLSYSIPQMLVKKVGVNNARIYFNGTNLLTFSKFKLYDPEVPYYAMRGWELPIGKTFTFGIDLGF
jgi:TonB-linked SusC/RagA family outer membrane protein